MKIKHFSISLGLSLGLAGVAAAQTEPDIFSMTLEELLEVEVVTASKISQDLNLAPSTIYVVTEQEILQNGYMNLMDILENVPGVVPINLDFFAYGGQRGFLSNFSQTLLLINGREMQNLIAAETFISHQFATHNIKQVEVVQGPGSALYGANAFVGVINIITKNGDKAFDEFDVQIELGSQNTRGVNLVFGKSLGDFRVNGSFRAFESDMWDFTDFVNDTVNYRPGLPNAIFPEDIRFLNYSNTLPYSLELGYKGLYVGANGYRLRTGKGYEAISLDYASQWDRREMDLYYAGWQRDFDKLSVNVEGQFWREKLYGENYDFSQGVFDRLVAEGRDSLVPIQPEEIHDEFRLYYSQLASTGSKRYRVNATGFWNPGGGLSVVGGYVFDMYDVLGVTVDLENPRPEFDETRSPDNNLRPPYFRQHKNAFFVQGQQALLGEKLFATGGARLDVHSIYGAVFTFRGGLVYHPAPRTYVKALYGQAFREPNVFEIGTSTLTPNPDLKPMTIDTYELSVTQGLGDYFSAYVVGYLSQATNFITPSELGLFVNSSEVKTVMGLESRLNFKYAGFTSDLSYSFVRPEDEVYAEQTVENLGVYRHRVSVGATYALSNKWFVNLRANHYGSVEAKHGNPGIVELIELPAFTRLNATISTRDLPLSDFFLRGMFTVRNVLGGEYYQPNIRLTGPRAFLQPGRQFVARVAFYF